MRKRILSICVLGITLFLAGCGRLTGREDISISDKEKEPVIMYQSELENIDTKMKGVHWYDIQVVGDALYYRVYRTANRGTATELAKISGDGLYKSVIGEEPRQIVNMYSASAYDITVDNAENIYVFKNEGSKEILQKYNSEGEFLYQKEVQESTAVLKDEKGVVSNSQMIASEQGVCVISGNGGYLLWDTQGQELGSGMVDWMKEGMYPITGDYGIVNGSKNTYIYHRNGRKLYLESVDYETGTLGAAIEIPLPQVAESLTYETIAGSLHRASDNGIYIVDYASLLRYDEITGELTTVFDWDEPGISVDKSNIKAIGEDESGNLRFYIYNYFLERAMIVSVGKEESDRVLLTIGALENNISRLEERLIQDFNLSQEDVFVAIKGYEDIYELQQAVISGQELDILELTGIDIEEYVEKDILESLDSYLNESETLEVKDFLPSVLEAMKYDGKVYFLAPRFKIWCMLLDHESTQREDLTWQRFLALDSKEAGYLCDWSREDVLRALLACDIDQYVNWNEKVCSFDDGRFAECLEALMTVSLPDKKSVNLYQDVMDGTYLAAFRSVSDLQQVKEMRESMEKIVSFNGLPDHDGNQAYDITFHKGMLGMLHESDKKEEAWNFMEYYLQENTEGHVRYNEEFSVLADRFRAQVENNVKENITYVYTSSYTGKQVREVFKFKEVDRELARNLVENVKMTGMDWYSGVIGDIIKEEVELFWESERTSEETAAVIQQRVSEYMKQ